MDVKWELHDMDWPLTSSVARSASQLGELLIHLANTSDQLLDGGDAGLGPWILLMLRFDETYGMRSASCSFRNVSSLLLPFEQRVSRSLFQQQEHGLEC